MINGLNHSDFTENMQRCHDYIKALEEERGKIQVFQRELPLCLELVTQAIETCKQQLSGQSECSEQTSSDVPVYEEFIPVKRASSDSDGEDHEIEKSKNDITEKSCKKSDWLRSVQLWNQIPDPPSKEDSNREFAASGASRNGDGPATEAAAALTSSSCMTENVSGKKEGRSPRKARRCWSPELHRRFLQVLQQLGGPHGRFQLQAFATPKQIRELMKVDGLTNDEVKSHLQKYRLHTRRPSPSNQNNNAQTPQFVVVGGLWMAREYASMEAVGGSASKEIYTPIYAPPPPSREPLLKQRQHEPPSCSPATSSSTHSITAVSPAC